MNAHVALIAVEPDIAFTDTGQRAVDRIKLLLTIAANRWHKVVAQADQIRWL